MSFLEKFRSMFQKSVSSRQVIAMHSMGRAISTPRNYEKFAEEGYQKNIIAYAAIAKVAQSCAGIDWVLYRRVGGKKKAIEIENHPLLDLLAKPNPMQGQAALIETLIGFYKIAGNTFLHLNAPTTKVPPRELMVLRPDRMKIKPGATGLPAAYIYKIGSHEATYEVDPVSGVSPIIHLKSFNPLNDWYGLSPIEPAIYPIDQHNESSRWNTALLQNQAKPSGALVMKVSDGNPSGSLSEEQRTALKAALDERHAGAANAGRVMLLEGGLDWKQLSLSPQDMDWINGKHTSARDIALAFGVPGQLIGIPGDSTYANYKEARQAFYEETILPQMDNVRDEFNRGLTVRYGDELYLDYDRDSVEALELKRQAVWDKVDKSTDLTINEKREAKGYEKIEGGDVLLVSAGMVPLSFVTEDPAATEEESSSVADQDDEEDGQEDSEGVDASADADEEEVGKENDKKSRGRHDLKIFNLSNEKDKLREWKRAVRLRASFERKLMRQLDATFEVEAEQVAKVVEGLDPRAAEIAATKEIDSNRKMWESVLSSNLTAAGRMFGERVLSSLKSLPNSYETKQAEIRFQGFLKSWVDRNVATKIPLLLETSRNKIRKAIQDAVHASYEEGSTIVDLAGAIKETYSGFSESRAMTIARTETVGASNAASEAAAKATGIPNLKKEWISSPADGRERPEHREVNGKAVDLDEEFEVGGVRMKRPGDGPADQVINCRCTIAFVRGE